MESLAFLVFVIFSAVFLCGPAAIVLSVNKLNILGIILAAISCWLGIYWFVTVYTWAKYLGLFSAACGLYAMYLAARNIQVGP